jgi:demethylmenaquinone methyltransferase/2-methoxy-6-polyprenyl-1,4-benzoquinol methylase
MNTFDNLLRDQMEYYCARATEYDQWFLRQGRYDHGEALNQRWFEEVAVVAGALEEFHPAGKVLELAAGTGLWTQRLARHAASITVVDSSAEMLALNRERMRGFPVDYVQADLFSWQPDAGYDVVFFGFWLSHVPPARFEDFWDLVRRCLVPGGRVFFVDSLYDETSTAVDHQLRGQDAVSVIRRLNDGREFEIVKVFYRPEDLACRLDTLGWQVPVESTPRFFLYGHGTHRM